MREVFLAQLYRFRIAFSVVVSVGKAESASGGKSNHLSRVAVILVRAESEEHAAAFGLQMKLRQKRRQLALRGEAINLVEVGLQGSGAKLIDDGFVHAGGEVVPDFLLFRVLAGRVP